MGKSDSETVHSPLSGVHICKIIHESGDLLHTLNTHGGIATTMANSARKNGGTFRLYSNGSKGRVTPWFELDLRESCGPAFPDEAVDTRLKVLPGLG
jgi:hypothetical protein